MTEPRLHLDYETASELNLKKVGGYRYASHHSTRILMLGWAINDEPEHLWEPHLNPEPPAQLVQLLKDPRVRKHAFNATFERLISRHCLGIEIPIEEWRCTMIEAFYLGFTGGLSKVLQAIGLEDKDKRGQQLINMFCSPAAKNHKADWYDWVNRPEEWLEFCGYCRQDVRVERALYHWLKQFPQMHQWDWDQYAMDQRINDRGVELDVGMAHAAVEIWTQEKANITEEMAELTSMAKVTRGPFVQYFFDTFGIELENTTKDYLAIIAKDPETPDAARYLIKLWAQKEAKATSKYNAVINVAGEGDRARGMFQYKGAARTDRVGGRLLQLQNLKRPFVKPAGIPILVNAIKCASPPLLNLLYPSKSVSEVLGGSIRHAIKAKEGHSLVIADLSSIESVVIGWLTMCTSIDKTFRSGKDSYKVFAEKFYGIPYDAVTKEQRSFSKPPVLGCGFMLGWKGLVAYAEGYGVDMDQATAKRAVDTFRSMYPEIPKFWDWIYKAVAYVTVNWQPIEGYRLKIERDADFLRIHLPSGRALSYYKPEMMDMPAPWDKNKTVNNFTYMGMNDKNQWVRISAHAGGVTENIVQSIAGDVLWHGVGNAEEAELPVVLHVHDEIAAEVPDAYAPEALKILEKCMIAPLPWAPDMWLGADGFITKQYTKD